MRYETLHSGFADVPVTLQVFKVDLRRLCGSGRFPIRVEFSVHHENGKEIPFLEKMWHPREYTSHPVHVAIDEEQLRKRFFADFLTDDELVKLLTRFYDYETAKRSFRLQPYFTEHNFRYWMVDICAHRQMAGLTVDNRVYCGSTGFVDWAHLYPKGTEERMRIHHLINRLGRDRQQTRRISAPHNRIRCIGGRRYGIGL